MIRAVAFCPSAPVLIPEVAQRAAPELDPLRAACRAAIRGADAPGRRWVLIGAGDTSGAFPASSRGTLAGFGVPLEVGLMPGAAGPLELPPALSVGAWLLHDALGPHVSASAFSVGAESSTVHGLGPAPDVALLVVGDGSARRSVKAPGHLDERAAAFDALAEQALRTGDPRALATLDPELGAQLLAAGVPVWRAVAAALPAGGWDASLLYADDPYGVAYLVAAWALRD